MSGEHLASESGPLSPNPNVEEQILSAVDDTTLGNDDWNTVIIECGSLAVHWRQLSIRLGLSSDVIETIAANHPSDVFQCWNKALGHWIKMNYNHDKFGKPSWKNLFRAVFYVDKKLSLRLASQHVHQEEVKVKPISMHHTYDVAGAEEVTTDERFSGIDIAKCKKKRKRRRRHQSADPRKDISAETVAKPQLSFPVLNQTKMSEEEKERLMQRLYAESVDIIYKFQELFSATSASLIERKVSIKELSSHLVCLDALAPTYKDSKLPVLRHKLPEIQETDAFHDAMQIISAYCSFFNYRLLEHIIDKLGTKQDKQNLAKYQQEFAEYAKRKIFECPSEVGNISDEGCTNMFVTLDESYNNCTLSSLHLFIDNLKKCLKLSPDVVIKLCRIEVGSIKLMFQIPCLVQPELFPLDKEQEEAIAQLGVLRLSCGLFSFDSHQNKGKDPDESENGSVSDDCETVITALIGLTDFGVKNGKASDFDSGIGRTISNKTRESIASISQFSERDGLTGDEPNLNIEYEAELKARLMPPPGSDIHKLHQASSTGDLNKIIQLVNEKKVNPVHKIPGIGSTALHTAAANGHMNVVKFFIEETECNPACQDALQLTPLHYAAALKHFKIVQYLVEKQGMDPLCHDYGNYTPFHRACEGGDIKTVRFLMKEMMKYYSQKEVIYDQTNDKKCSLHIAAHFGHLQLIKLFVSELQSDPNVPGWQGRAPIHNAAQEGHFNIVKYLIEIHHCDPLSSKNDDKKTTLHLASGKGYLDIVKYLVFEKKCDPYPRDNSNNTPFHDAARYGQLNVVTFYIETLHCSLAIPGIHNWTAIDLACNRGHLHLLQYFDKILMSK